MGMDSPTGAIISSSTKPIGISFNFIDGGSINGLITESNEEYRLAKAANAMLSG